MLNATIDMYAYCTVEVTNDNKIIFYAADKDEYFESLAKSHLEIDGKMDLHKGVYNQIIKDKVDIRTFAKYIGKSWEAKKNMASSITNQYIDNIYDEILNAGAFSGKITGAGGGGFMMLMIDPIKKLSVIKALNKFEGKAANFHFTNQGTVGWKIL